MVSNFIELHAMTIAIFWLWWLCVVFRLTYDYSLFLAVAALCTI